MIALDRKGATSYSWELTVDGDTWYLVEDSDAARVLAIVHGDHVAWCFPDPAPVEQ